MHARDRDNASEEFVAIVRKHFDAWVENASRNGERPFDSPRFERLPRYMQYALIEAMQSELIQQEAIERMFSKRIDDWKEAMKKRLTTSRKFRSELIEEVASLVVQEWE